MTTVDGPPTSEPRKILNRTSVVLAVGLVIAYLAMLVIMVVLRADENWDRLVYILTGFEAVAFSGAGLLFGVRVERQRGDDASTEAQHARAELRASDTAADAGRALASFILAKADASLSQPDGPPTRGVGSTPNGAGWAKENADLLAACERLFPGLR